MTCPKCGRSNPEESRFCIYCATALTGTEEVDEATGPTVRLDPAVPIPVLSLAPAAPAPPPPPTMPGLAGRKNEVSGALWLIGLGILFLTGSFWPGILVLVGLTAYVQQLACGRSQESLRSLIFFVGLAVLFWTNLFWPGILILLGLIALISPEIRRRQA